MTLGPDGRLYLTAGCGNNLVEGSDGGRATALQTGAVFRCRPDGSKLETYAIGFVNPYGDAAFDAAGNLFLADNDGSGRGYQLLHVPESADFGWRKEATKRPLPAAFAHPPGELPPMLKPDAHAASGLLIYNDSRFPENYRGLLLCPDLEGPGAFMPTRWSAKVGCSRSKRSSSSSRATTRCSGRARWSSGRTAPCMSSDSRAGGWLWGDGEHGRIYRLTWAGTKDQPALPPRGMDSWAKIAKLGDDDLVKTLQSEEASDRERAQRELARRGEKERPALLKLLKDAEQPDAARMAALGALGSMWDGDVQAAAVFVMQKDSMADLRRLAADAVGLNAARGDDDVHNGLLRALNDVAPGGCARSRGSMAMSRVLARRRPRPTTSSTPGRSRKAATCTCATASFALSKTWARLASNGWWPSANPACKRRPTRSLRRSR